MHSLWHTNRPNEPVHNSLPNCHELFWPFHLKRSNKTNAKFLLALETLNRLPYHSLNSSLSLCAVTSGEAFYLLGAWGEVLLAGLRRENEGLWEHRIFELIRLAVWNKEFLTEVENVTTLSYILLKLHDCIHEDRKAKNLGLEILCSQSPSLAKRNERLWGRECA